MAKEITKKDFEKFKNKMNKYYWELPTIQ